MKKKIFGVVLLIAIILCSIYFILKHNPPLEIGTLASSGDNKSVILGVGNKGFRDVEILDVSVNNNETPSIARLQVSNELLGFIITDDYNSIEAKKYGFTNINDVTIKTGTTPSTNFEKLGDSASEIYAVSVIHNEEIKKVHISYNYLGISFNETVKLN